MVQALKSGDIDYAHNVNPEQFKELLADPAFTADEGAANGWTQLAFNTYGTGTGKTIEDGGPSTKALLDPAFRDALGYAIDKAAARRARARRLRRRGHDQRPADPRPTGTSSPTTPRTFDLDARQAEARGRRLHASTARASASTRRATRSPSALIYPNTNDDLLRSRRSSSQEWYARDRHRRLAPEPRQRAPLTNLVLPPEGDPPGKADYDIELWGWAGSPDPELPAVDLHSATQIGVSSDSQYCNPAYDALYERQLTARPATDAQGDARRDAEHDLRRGAVRHPVLRRLPRRLPQRPVRGLAEHAERGGMPFFTYGTLGYTLLTDATAQPSPTPGGRVASAGRRRRTAAATPGGVRAGRRPRRRAAGPTPG